MYAVQLVIVDGSDVSRAGLKAMLAPHLSHPITTFTHLAPCQRYLSQQPVDLLLLDDGFWLGGEAAAVVKTLHIQYSQLRIMVLSTRAHLRYIRNVLDSGAVGFVDKADLLEEVLITGIITMNQGRIYLSPGAAALPFGLQTGVIRDVLDERELSVLHLMQTGRNAGEIAAMLSITPRTLHRIRTRLRVLLGVRTNEQMVSAALQQGLLSQPSDFPRTVP